MKLRNRKNLVSHGAEGAAPKRRAPRVTQWLYFGLLFALLGYLAWLGFNNLVFVEVRGQVEVEKTQVSPTRGGLVNDLALTEGTQVAKGTLLARVEPDKACGDPEANPRIGKLDYDIQLLEGRIELMRSRLQGLFAERRQHDLKRALEMDGSRRRDLGQLSRDIDKLKLDIRLADKEMALKRDTLAQLRAAPPAPRPECAAELLHAPFDARVITVHYRNHEYARRGDPVVTLEALDAPVRIEAYADNRQFNRWQGEEEVTVRFPDGSATEGLVDAVHSAAYNTPARQWDEYIPVEARLRIHLRPADNDDGAHWRDFDRMDVTIRMYR